MAGHNKNGCDGAFSDIKRNLRHTDAYCPKDVMDLIYDSSNTTICTPGTKVFWWNWKIFLAQFFRVPNNLAITKYYLFITDKDSPVILFPKFFSLS